MKGLNFMIYVTFHLRLESGNSSFDINILFMILYIVFVMKLISM